MSKSISGTSLSVDDFIIDEQPDDAVDFLPLEGYVEDPPHLVFLISGIRSQGYWAQDAIESLFTTNGQEIIFRPVRGNGRSSSGRLCTSHLITRFALEPFRRSFSQQIKFNLEKHPNALVSVFAHSMGSALFTDIVEEISQHLASEGRQLENIVFLGSVCHRRHSERLSSNCHRFINDVGVRDHYPFLASTVRPDHYSDVGLLGFSDGYRQADRYFNNDHSSCTSIEHMENYLIPLLDRGFPFKYGEGARPRWSENNYEYTRRAAQIVTLVLVPVAVALTLPWSLLAIFIGLIGLRTLLEFT